MPRWVPWCKAGFGTTVGRCLWRWVSPHSMPAKKHRLHWKHAGTAWPFQKQRYSPCLTETPHAPPGGDKDRGVVLCLGGTQRGVIPWARDRTAAASSGSYLRVGRLRRGTASILLLPARGETSPCGKCQSGIRVPLPPRFGHRSLMSGGKQIKSP